MSEGTFEGWVPDDYLDEVVPPCRPHPNAWLLPGDVMRLAAFDKEDDATDPGRPLTDGARVVFYSLTSYGRLTIHVARDGTFKTEGDIPAGARQFCLPHDPDTLSDSVADLAQNLADFGEHGAFDVNAYTWCDGTLFELRDGAFVELASETAP